MPIYHFNVRDGVNLRDDEGHELPDIMAAKRESVRLAGWLIREMSDSFWSGEEWRMEVTDERGLILFSLDFATQDAPALLGSAIRMDGKSRECRQDTL